MHGAFPNGPFDRPRGDLDDDLCQTRRLQTDGRVDEADRYGVRHRGAGTGDGNRFGHRFGDSGHGTLGTNHLD